MGKRVLVVDDSADSADAVAVLLETEGHDVRTAATARAALDVVMAWAPDAVVLDIGLPDMDGHALAREIARLPVTPRPRLVALSGHGQAEHRARSREAGIACHLLKPAEPEALFAALREPALG